MNYLNEKTKKNTDCKISFIQIPVEHQHRNRQILKSNQK